jgi:hypothetical protein
MVAIISYSWTSYFPGEHFPRAKNPPPTSSKTCGLLHFRPLSHLPAEFQGSPPHSSPNTLAQTGQHSHTSFTRPPLQFSLYNGVHLTSVHGTQLWAIGKMTEITKAITRKVFIFQRLLKPEDVYVRNVIILWDKKKAEDI